MKSNTNSILCRTFSPVWGTVLMVLLILSGAVSVWAGENVWSPVGPEGGWIRSLTADPKNPGVVYALTGYSGNIIKSSDGARSWSALQTGLSCCRALAIDPDNSNTLYVGTSGAGILRSQDGGENWNVVNSGLPVNPDGHYPNINALAVAPSGVGTIYAATGNGVFKSIDGGTNWSEVNSGLLFYLNEKSTNVLALAIDPQDSNTIYAAVYSCCVIDVPSVFKSIDGGASWNAASSGLPTYAGSRYLSVISLFIRPSSSGTLYAVIDDERVFTSTDGGARWAPAAFPAEILVSDPQSPGTVYAGTAYGVLKSTDAGDSWNPASSGLPTSPSGSALNISALALDPDGTGTLYAGSGMIGVFKSADGGASWNAANSGILASFVSSLAIDPEDSATIYAAAGLVFKSGDGGAHWSALNFGPPCCVSTLAIDAQDPSTIYAAVQNGGVWKSADAGVSWANVAAFNAVGITIDPQNTGTVYVGVQGAGTFNGGIWKSTDAGTTWTKSVVPAGGGVHGFRIDSRAPSNLLAWNAQGLYKSTDGGERWSTLYPAPVGALFDLEIDPRNSAILYTVTEHGVIKSTDGGANWIAVNSGLPTENGVRVLSIDPQNPDVVYGSSYGWGVFRSTDGGASWNAVNSGLTTLLVNAVAIDPRNNGTAYAVTSGGGVFAIHLVP